MGDGKFIGDVFCCFWYGMYVVQGFYLWVNKVLVDGGIFYLYVVVKGVFCFFYYKWCVGYVFYFVGDYQLCFFVFNCLCCDVDCVKVGIVQVVDGVFGYVFWQVGQQQCYLCYVVVVFFGLVGVVKDYIVNV